MLRNTFNQFAAFISDNWAGLEKHEREYKEQHSPEEYHRLLQWTQNPTTEISIQKHLNLLNWRVVDVINQMAANQPVAFANALTHLWETQDADRFWQEVDPTMQGIAAENLKHLNGVGTRASVASYFLVIKDPHQIPFYRPSYGGKGIAKLYGSRGNDALDQSSPGKLLKDYLMRCQYLKNELKDFGVPVRDMIDVQSALYMYAQNFR